MFLTSEVPLYLVQSCTEFPASARSVWQTVVHAGADCSGAVCGVSSQLILSECTYEASLNLLWTPHNLACLCPHRAQIPTECGSGVGLALLSSCGFTWAPRPYETPPPYDPTEILRLGTYGGSRAVSVSCERGTPLPGKLVWVGSLPLSPVSAAIFGHLGPTGVPLS